MVAQDEMELDSPLGVIVRGPIEDLGTKGEDRCIQA